MTALHSPSRTDSTMDTTAGTAWSSGDAYHLLTLYLRDHEAAGAGGAQLAKRCAKHNRETEFAADLAALADDIASDRVSLNKIMDGLGVEPSRPRGAIAWLGTQISGLKPNIRVRSYSPLSRMFELETLAAGVKAKSRLWAALLRTAEVDGRIDSSEIAALIVRATQQLQLIDSLHDCAVGLAFVDATAVACSGGDVVGADDDGSVLVEGPNSS